MRRPPAPLLAPPACLLRCARARGQAGAGGVGGAVALGAALTLWPWAGAAGAAPDAAGPPLARKGRPHPPRAARVQVLSGAGLALPSRPGPEGGRGFAAYVPVDLELGLQVSGPLSLVLGGVGYLAPFVAPDCPGSSGRRPNALAAYAGLRLDPAHGGRGYLAPWLALRGGVAGQDGVATGARCVERLVIQPWFGPRAGLDLRLGRAALTAAVGYDHLPRASAITIQLGLALRLF